MIMMMKISGMIGGSDAPHVTSIRGNDTTVPAHDCCCCFCCCCCCCLIMLWLCFDYTVNDDNGCWLSRSRTRTSSSWVCSCSALTQQTKANQNQTKQTDGHTHTTRRRCGGIGGNVFCFGTTLRNRWRSTMRSAEQRHGTF